MNKSKQSISAFLGLTQLEVAMLLGVSRSRWSLYELGLRGIPLAALEKLHKMLAAMQTYKPAMEKHVATKKEKEQHDVVLQGQLTENNFQQQRMVLKMAAIEKKEQVNAKRLHLAQRLDKSKFKESFQTGLIDEIETNSTKSLEKNSWSQLAQCQIKLQVLQYEEKLLREASGSASTGSA